MVEFARSELAVTAATMDRVTEAGHKWYPPQYHSENRRWLQEMQARYLEEPGGLDEVGAQGRRAYLLSGGGDREMGLG